MADEEKKKSAEEKATEAKEEPSPGETAKTDAEVKAEGKKPAEKTEEKGDEKTDKAEAKEAKNIVSSTEELDEKKVKRAFVDKFRKKKNKKGKDSKSEEAVDAQPSSTDEVAEQIYQKIARSESHEYWTIRLRKKTVLVVLGVIIFLLWVGLFANFFMQSRGIQYPWQDDEQEVKEASASAVIVTEDDEGYKIRIRNIVGDEEGAIQLAQYLQSKGYTAVEVLEDSESEFDGVAIVVKADGNEIRDELDPVVKEMYETSSPSAELTNDSDFDAVILYAPQERAASPSAEQS